MSCGSLRHRETFACWLCEPTIHTNIELQSKMFEPVLLVVVAEIEIK